MSSAHIEYTVHRTFWSPYPAAVSVRNLIVMYGTCTVQYVQLTTRYCTRTRTRTTRGFRDSELLVLYEYCTGTCIYHCTFTVLYCTRTVQYPVQLRTLARSLNRLQRPPNATVQVQYWNIRYSTVPGTIQYLYSTYELRVRDLETYIEGKCY